VSLNPFTEFIGLLRQAGLDPDAEAIADALWLARFQARSPPRSSPPDAYSREGGPQPSQSPLVDAPADLPPPRDDGRKPLPTPQVATTHPDSRIFPDVLADRRGRRASPVQVPAASALPGALNIARALRPLGRRHPAPHRRMLDEDATAEAVAQFGIVRPVLVPMPERWFNVALVVDASRSMEVWRTSILEFQRLLERQGAFAQISRWRLLVGDRVSIESAGCQARDVSALNDPRGRTLILIVTNGVAAFWDGDPIARALAAWSAHGPVAILQVFAENHWAHTVLGPATCWVRAIVPGAAGRALEVRSQSWGDRGPDGERPLTVPVLSLAPDRVARWAGAVMAMGQQPTPAVVFRPGVTAADWPSEPEPSTGPLDPRAQVERFRSIASSEAFRLICHLAAVPLMLPIMRMVQRQIFREPRIEHLGEVIASGLIERVAPPDANADPDTVLYDFVVGVRDVLFGAVQVGSVFEIRARVQSALKAFVERQLGHAIINFRAFILDRKGEYELPPTLEAFVEIERDLLQRLWPQRQRRDDTRAAEGAPGLAAPTAAPSSIPPSREVLSRGSQAIGDQGGLATGVLLQGFYKIRRNVAVTSPADGDRATPWWWDHLAAQASDLRAAGFTAVWLPPALKTASGSSPGADGYGPFDDYDIGSRDQRGSVPTRYGTREQLQRCVAVLRANGLDVYLDMVENHRIGDPGNFVFRYPGADGTPEIGRFPKDPLNFVPNVPRDPNLGGPVSSDFVFGRKLAPINGKPLGYVFNGLIDAADWLTRALDAQGYCLDNVKGLSTDFLHPFLNSKAMAGKFAVGDFFHGNPTLVNQWIFNPKGMAGRPSAFDYPLKFMLTSMCNNPGRFNMADLDHAGFVGISPLNAVTLVENDHTDLMDGQSIVSNKMMAYAYILTSEGYPCVYYRDYSTDPNCYGLRPHIDNLIWIHEKLATGPTEQRWKDFDLFAYERLGGPHLLVALNNDPVGPRTIRVDTGFGAHVPLHDYTGHGPDAVTAGDGAVTLTVPRNADGAGYVCYSRAGIGGGFAVTTRAVTQEFEGAPDLDLPPAVAGQTVQAGRVWCAAETPIRAALAMPGLSASTEVTVEIAGPDGAIVATRSVAGQNAAHSVLEARAARAGFHGLRLRLGNAPDGTNADYKLAVTYTGSRTLAAEGVRTANPGRSRSRRRSAPPSSTAR
jgi:alpha-amylase